MSSSSVPNSNDDQLQPALKKVKANNFRSLFNDGSGGQMLNSPSPTNLPVFTSSKAVQPALTHMLWPSVPPGFEFQQQIPLYNQRVLGQLPQNQPQPHIQQGHPQLLPQANNFCSLFNDGSGGQMLNSPSPTNLPVFTSSKAVQPALTHMLWPSVPPGFEFQQQIPLYNQRVLGQLPQNQPQPHIQQGHPQLLPQANNFRSLFNDGSGGQMLNSPSPTNLPVFTSSKAVQPALTHMLWPSVPPGFEFQQQIPLYNQRVLGQLPQNQPQPHIQQGHPQLLPQVSQDENRKFSKQGVSTEQTSVKRYIPLELSLDNFPYYLSERTKHHLVASYFLHLNRKVQISQPKLQPTDRVLLSGPEGSHAYQEALAMALAHQFGAKLLVFDCQINLNALSTFGRQPSDEVLRFYMHLAIESSVSYSTLPPFYWKPKSRALKKGDKVIYTGLRFSTVYSNIATRGPSFGYRGKILVVNSTSNEHGVRFDLPIQDGNDLRGLCEANHGYFCNGNEICLDIEGEVEPIFAPNKGFCSKNRLIVFLKNIESGLTENFEGYFGVNIMVKRLPDSVFVIGSHIQNDCTKQKDNLNGKESMDLFFINTKQVLLNVFSEGISIEMPEDKKMLDMLKSQLIRDGELLNAKENDSILKRVLTESELECEGIETVQVTDHKLSDENADKVIKWALGRQLMTHQRYNRNSKLVISRESIVYGLDNLRAVQTNDSREDQELNERSQDQGIPTLNEFEKRILEDVILHDKINIKFDDIGALDNIKDSLKEAVIWPMKRPGLFRKGPLRKLCKGMLLFGPPGTGKSMLAKAVAAEAGANLFNISASIIASKWSADSQNFVQALSSLATKMAPSVVFIDEAYSLFRKRMFPTLDKLGKMKNNFMLYWDGLHLKDEERVIVIAATNRPSELDETFIKRVPCRLMVNLPDTPSRCKILKVILEKEELTEDVNFNAIAQMTNGFSGKDLKTLCIAAARRPIHEIILKDKLKCTEAEEEDADIHPLNMEDFKYGFDQVKGESSNGQNSVHGGSGDSGGKPSPAI